jgi:tetratricopeptide (TPR) repeat protein
MPERTYMVIDPRRDHSIRIPRPDLSEKIGSPNACNKCHKEKSNQWSVNYINNWYGKDLLENPHYGEILYAGQTGFPGAGDSLTKLVLDTSQAKIVRASALWLLGRYPGQTSAQVIRSELNHNDPLIRYAALHALDIFTPNDRLALAKHLLQDPVLAIRNEAVRVLASVSPGAFSPSRRKVFEDALAENIKCHMVNADHYSTHLNLGTLHLNLKQYDIAEESYKTAIRFEPGFIYSYINLADLYRLQNREDEGERILRSALDINPNSSNIHHALGLLLARKNRLPEALSSMKRATELNPDDPNLSYVYGIALNSIGKVDSAVVLLKQAHQRHPYNLELLFAIVTIQRDRGFIDSAIQYARKLVLLAPQNPNYNQLLNQLESQK